MLDCELFFDVMQTRVLFHRGGGEPPRWPLPVGSPTVDVVDPEAMNWPRELGFVMAVGVVGCEAATDQALHESDVILLGSKMVRETALSPDETGANSSGFSYVFEEKPRPWFAFDSGSPSPDCSWSMVWLGESETEWSLKRDEGPAVFRPEPSTEPKVGTVHALEIRCNGRAVKRWSAAVLAKEAIVDASPWKDLQQARHEENLEGLLAGVELARKLRVPSEVTRGLRLAAFRALRQLKFELALRYLDDADAVDEAIGYREGRMRNSYYRAMIAKELGQLNRAANQFIISARDAHQLGLSRAHAYTTKELALTLQSQGLHSEALATMDRAGSYFEQSLPEDRHGYFVDLAWITARAMDAGAVPVDWDEPEVLWQDELEVAESNTWRESALNIEANLAWLSLLRGDASLALERAMSIPRGQFLENPFVQQLVGESALRARRVDQADAQFRSLLEEYRRAGLVSEWWWRSAYGLARVEESRHRLDSAWALYLEALDILRRNAEAIGLLSGRGAFFYDRRTVVEDAVALALRYRGADAALELVEDAYSAVVVQLGRRVRLEALNPSEREDWFEYVARIRETQKRIEDRQRRRDLLAVAELSRFDNESVELAQDLQHQLELAVGRAIGTNLLEDVSFLRGSLGSILHPDECAWVTFAIGDEAIHFWVTPFGVSAGNEPPDLEHERFSHLYLIGSDARVRFQSLIGQRSVSVVPSLRVLRLLRAQSAAKAPSTLSVFADPTSDLPWARREGERVSELIGADFYQGSAVDRDRFVRALSSSSLVHYSGHAVTQRRDPWATSLRLAEGQSLSVADVLLEPVTSRMVFLNGCDTSSTPGDFADTPSLPSVLLLAGARTVTTVDGAIEDAVASRAGCLFYEHGGEDEPVRAFQHVARELERNGIDAWRRFVVWGLPR
ncbi:MAG: CHAT domain-containing protein [Myxococcota bacterium]